MPMPTTSPDDTLPGSHRSSVSYVTIGSPYSSGVAAARTYSHRGVITPTPNANALGLTRCTLIQSPDSNRYARNILVRPHSVISRPRSPVHSLDTIGV